MVRHTKRLCGMRPAYFSANTTGLALENPRVGPQLRVCREVSHELRRCGCCLSAAMSGIAKVAEFRDDVAFVLLTPLARAAKRLDSSGRGRLRTRRTKARTGSLEWISTRRCVGASAFTAPNA
jgi:hypothetical protein